MLSVAHFVLYNRLNPYYVFCLTDSVHFFFATSRRCTFFFARIELPFFCKLNFDDVQIMTRLTRYKTNRYVCADLVGDFNVLVNSSHEIYEMALPSYSYV